MSNISTLPFGHGVPPARGTLRGVLEDFRVDEDLGFAPSGAGEHVLLQIRKRGANTDWVARRIARLAGVRAMAVSYAGMKDRNAVTSQWFSVHLPGRAEPDWSALCGEQIELLTVARHHRKLRRGALQGNRFELVVRNLEGDRGAVDGRLQIIAAQGVPAYFGAQRFGREGGNVARAREMFAGARVSRHERGILLSAARSGLFNRVLAERVRRADWNRMLDGDVAMLDGSHSVFAVERADAELQYRCQQLDIHPTGPLWGRGALPSAGEVLALEQGALVDEQALRAGLESAGLEQQRRALRHRVHELTWEWCDGPILRLAFGLDRGNYATSVVREFLGDGADSGDSATDV